MNPIVIETLARLFSRDQPLKQLTFEIYIYEKPAYPSVDAVLTTLETLSFCAWVGETLAKYAAYVAEGRVGIYRNDLAVIMLDKEVAIFRNNKLSKKDFYEQRADMYARFQAIRAEAASTTNLSDRRDALELQLVSVSKINPNILKVIVMGPALALGITLTTMVSLEGYHTLHMQECIQAQDAIHQYQYGEMIKLERFQGKNMTTVEVFGSISTSWDAGFAACQQPLFPWKEIFTETTGVFRWAYTPGSKLEAKQKE